MKREPIKMPVLSDTMETGHLIRWKKQPGDLVKKGDILAEIESDKAVMDLEAFDEGYLAGPLAQPDSDIPVGSVIGYLADSKDAALAAAPEKAAEEKTAEPMADVATEQKQAKAVAPTPTDTPPPVSHTPPPVSHTPPPQPVQKATPSGKSGKHKASPYARGLARELGVDLAALQPGNGGVISSREVLAAALDGPQPNLQAGPPFRYKLLTSMHRAVADNMSATLRTPTFHISAELPVEPLQQAAHKQKTSFTLLLARAAALTIAKHPKFNMAYTRFGLAVRERVDVGIAVDVPGGLVTPVIRDVATRSVPELTEDWRILRDKTRRQRLVPADYEGATFYVSNMGMFSAVRSFDAIVPLGAAAILAVGASRDGKAMMTLSCDHRVVYGADAARFMETLETHLQEPDK